MNRDVLKFLFRKLGLALITIIGASLVAFLLIRLIPGDPVLNLLGERGGDPALVAEMRSKLGIDQSYPVQYFNFMTSLAQGDFGDSVVSRRPVMEEFWDRFPATAELAMASLFWATLLGIPLGILAALKRGSFFELGISSVALIGYSLPIFWWGLILIMFFSVNLGITPVSGRIGIEFDIPVVTGFLLIDSWFSEEGFAAFKSALMHLVLPAIALGTIPLAVIVRMTRSSIVEVLGEDFIRACKARGLSAFRVVFIHALRNALIPVITVVGLMLGTLLTGAVLTETIFSWPGIGKWLVKSVEARDYPVIQAGVLLISILVVFVNMFVDLVYLWVNPKIRGQK